MSKMTIYERRLWLESRRTGLVIINALLRLWLQEEAVGALARWSEETDRVVYLMEVVEEEENRERIKADLIAKDRATELAFTPEVPSRTIETSFDDKPKGFMRDDWSNFTNVFPEHPNKEEDGTAVWQIAASKHKSRGEYGNAGGWMGHSRQLHPKDGCICDTCKQQSVFMSSTAPNYRNNKGLGQAYPDISCQAMPMHPVKAGHRKIAQKKRYSNKRVSDIMGAAGDAYGPLNRLPRTQTPNPNPNPNPNPLNRLPRTQIPPHSLSPIEHRLHAPHRSSPSLESRPPKSKDNPLGLPRQEDTRIIDIHTGGTSGSPNHPKP